MCGIDGVELRLEPELVCDTDDLDTLMNVDALVITLPARRSARASRSICRRCRRLSTARWHTMCRVLFLPAQPRSTVMLKVW